MSDSRKIGKPESDAISKTSHVPSPFFNVVGFTEEYKEFYAPPSGRSLREARFKVLEIGPLHNFLEKRCE
jgi:hypothetical protein